MQNYRLLLSLILLFSLLTNCEKDPITDTNVSTIADWPVDPITVKLVGQILSSNQTSIPGATISINSTEVISDQNGYFSFTPQVINRFGTAIKVSAPGFYTTTQMIYPEAVGTHLLEVTMTTKEIITQFPTETGGEFNIQQAYLKLPANGYIDASGQSYTGTVMVAAKWIDAFNPIQLSQLPNSNLAQMNNGTMASILPSGVLAVELFDEAGNVLQIAPNAKATIHLPIAPNTQNSTTTNQPIWYLDEENGRWIEAGAAERIGDIYVAEVTHFTFWCCSAPYPAVFLTGTLKTPDGEAVAHRTVSMEATTTGTLAGGVRTDINGRFGGFAPKDENLRMVIWNACFEEAFSTQVGSFAQPTELGTFTIDNDEYYQVRGQVQDCQFQALEGAIVTYRIGEFNRNALADLNGHYRGEFFWCSDLRRPNVESRAADLNNALVTDWVAQPMTPLIDFGVQVACEELQSDFIEVNCMEETSLFLTPSAGSYYGSPQLAVWDSLYLPQTSMEEFGLFLEEPTFPPIGNIWNPERAFFYFNTDGNVHWQAYCETGSNGQNCNDFRVVLNESGGPGEYVGGTFEGTLYGKPTGSTAALSPLHVSGRFRVRQ